MKKYVIIVAGGKGMRMGGEVPKQFLPVGGRPVLMRTMEAFFNYDASIQIVLVLPVAQQEFWMGLCEDYSFDVPYRLANGGETRFHSVKNGLAEIPEMDADTLIAVHDGVRPFVSRQVIARCFDEAAYKGAVVPVVDMVDSVRRVLDNGMNRVEDRDSLKLVQTPQIFRADILKKAYDCVYSPLFTDDASVVEASGGAVALVTGNRENIKITTPFDLKLSEVLLTE